MQDTIFALASGTPPCGVAVVRVSGPGVRSICQKMTGAVPVERHASFRCVQDPLTSQEIDSGLVLFFKGPRSFTGEDCLELQLHGSRAVVRKVFEVLGSFPNTRLAEPGEFIRRAFDNDRMALTSIEGIGDLIDARTDAQRRQALAQAGGHLADRAHAWREQLLEALSLVEAEIDFADEGEAPVGVLAAVREMMADLLKEFEAAVSDADRAELIREGIRVVIAGKPNAGKSSLMNCLVRRDVAIVTDVPGTTRDLIEVVLDLDGVSVRLLDTAGIRASHDPVEQIGIGRTLSAVKDASIVVWIQDATDPDPTPKSEMAGLSLTVASKLDLVSTIPIWADMGLSVHSGVGVDALLNRLSQMASALAGGEPALVTNERQKGCVDEAARHLRLAMSNDALEFVAEDLRTCVARLQGLVGRIDSEDVLGSIFARFCMGK